MQAKKIQVNHCGSLYLVGWQPARQNFILKINLQGEKVNKYKYKYNKKLATCKTTFYSKAQSTGGKGEQVYKTNTNTNAISECNNT